MKVTSDSMRTETFNFTGYNGAVLPAMLWMPDDEPKVIHQITHGMTDHIIMANHSEIRKKKCGGREGHI